MFTKKIARPGPCNVMKIKRWSDEALCDQA